VFGGRKILLLLFSQISAGADWSEKSSRGDGTQQRIRTRGLLKPGRLVNRFNVDEGRPIIRGKSDEMLHHLKNPTHLTRRSRLLQNQLRYCVGPSLPSSDWGWGRLTSIPR
jgi:hypothetical protein